MGILITILAACLLYLLTFWVYGFYLHRLKAERDEWVDAFDEEIKAHVQTQLKLNQVPRSVRDYYSKK